MECAVAIAQARAAQREIFDSSLEAGDGDDLADVVLIFKQYEDPVEHVLEDGLGAKADSNAEDTCGGQQWLVGNIEDRKNLQKCEEADDSIRSGTEDGGHGAKLCGAVEVADLLFCAIFQALDEELHYAENDKSDDENADKLR